MTLNSTLAETEKFYDNFIIESSLFLSYDKYSKRALNLYRTKMGLESATSLYVDISTEGFFEWIKNKVKVLDHKFTVLMNKLYAKFKKLDSKTKENIERASREGPDAEIELPISPAKAKLILAALAATVAGVAFGFKHLRNGGTDSDGERKNTKDKVTEAWEKAGEKEEGKKYKWKNSFIVKFWKSIKDYVAKMWKGLKSFFTGSEKAVQQDAQEAKGADDSQNSGGKEGEDKPAGEDKSKKGLFERIKSKGGWFMSIFGMVSVGFGKVTKCMGFFQDAQKAVGTAKEVYGTVQSATGGGKKNDEYDHEPQDVDTRHTYVVAGVVPPKLVFQAGTESKACTKILPKMGKHIITSAREWSGEIVKELKLEKIRKSTMDEGDTIIVAYQIKSQDAIKDIKTVGELLQKKKIDISDATIYRSPGKIPSGFGS